MSNTMNNTTHTLRTLFRSMAVALSIAQSLVAADVTLAWSEPTQNADGSTLSNLAGYKIYYGLSGQAYTDSVDVGNVTTATLSGFEVGSTYDFAVTTYNSELTESPFSTTATWVAVDGTGDPSQPPVLLAIAPLAGGGLSLTWQSAAGRTYRIERTTDLTEPFIACATGVPSTEPTNEWQDLAPLASGTVFYRIVEES